MAIDPKKIKELRELTGAGVIDCKKALEESQGNYDKAIEILKAKHILDANKTLTKAAAFSKIGTYNHAGKFGVLLELACQTDFVARDQGFEDLLKDLCVQIVSNAPAAISRDDLPRDLIETERAKLEEEFKGKPEEIRKKIIEDKLTKTLFAERCLLDQQFYNELKFKGTVADLIKNLVAQYKEPIKVLKFVRFEVGKSTIYSEAKVETPAKPE